MNIRAAALIASASAASLACGTSQAGLVIVDGLDGAPVPSVNDFKAELAGLGLDRVFDGGSDVMVAQDGVVEFYFHGSESDFDNQFVVDATFEGETDVEGGTVLATETDGPFSVPGVFIGSIQVTAGQKFSELGIGFNVLNGNKQQQDGPAGTQGFGVFYNSGLGGNGVDYEQLVFGFDDNGFNEDDNHDDMIVRAVYVVPEPGAAALLAIGSVAMMGRRRRA